MKSATRKLAVTTVAIVGLNIGALTVLQGTTQAQTIRGTSVRATLSEVDRVIVGLNGQIAKAPTSSSLDLLAKMQLSRGRLTGDPVSYAKAQQAAEQSLSIAPRNIEGRTILSEVRLSNHNFRGALEQSTAVLADDPKQLGALAVRGDAERELGNYDAAIKTQRELQTLAPNSPSVIIRASRLSFLTGDPAKAKTLAERAEILAQKSGLPSSGLSFYAAFRGQLAFDSGDYSEATKLFECALTIAPGERSATMGLGASLAAQGKLKEATRLIRELNRTFPDPGGSEFLGDLLAAQGDADGAKAAYAQVQPLADRAVSNRAVYAREIAVFNANAGKNLNESLRVVREDVAARPDIFAYEALAWVEYRAGNFDAAEVAITKAMSTGIVDAHMYFYAGMIASARGERDLAIGRLTRSQQISPKFDLASAAEARAELKRLRSK
jgi:tetratricopeptide (TPR) repeat protein